MLSVVSILLLLSVFVQSLAALLALRLNWRYGWRWAWTLICIAVALMTLRRALALYRALVVLDDPVIAIVDEQGDVALSEVAAGVSLFISVLIFLGVVAIDPIFGKLARAEELLRNERDGLQQVVNEKEAEFRIARRIQQTLFPKGDLRTGSIHIAGRSWPATETGGDYFDYFALPDGSLLLIVADVTGHGLGPAMVTAGLRIRIRTIAEVEFDPGRLLTRLNTYIAEDSDEYFITMFAARIAPDSRQFTYACAGHQAYCLQATQVTTLDSRGLPLGVMVGSSYETSAPQDLEPGDLLLLPTDGLLEAMSATQEQFGVDRAVATIREGRGLRAIELVEKLHEQVRQFAGDRFDDDVTIVAAQVVDQTDTS